MKCGTEAVHKIFVQSNLFHLGYILRDTLNAYLNKCSVFVYETHQTVKSELLLSIFVNNCCSVFVSLN
jgi:hypothetical protein